MKYALILTVIIGLTLFLYTYIYKKQILLKPITLKPLTPEQKEEIDNSIRDVNWLALANSGYIFTNPFNQPKP